MRRKRASKSAAQEALLAASDEVRRQGELNDDDVTLGELLDRFLAQRESLGRSAGTLRTYRYVVDAHLVNWKTRPVRDLNPRVLQRLLVELQVERGTGAATNARKVLSGALQAAVVEGIIDRNPIRELPRLERPNSRASEPVPLQKVPGLLKAMREHPELVRLDMPDMFTLMVTTGLRVGEVCALRWQDIDAENRTLTVSGTAVRYKGAGVVRQDLPKTDSSARVIPIPRALVEMLRVRKKTPENPYILPGKDDRPRDPSNIQRVLRDTRADLGYPNLSTHSFRKTAAQGLDDAGLTAAEVAAHLGHSSPGVTLNVYLRRTRSAVERTTAALDEVSEGWL